MADLSDSSDPFRDARKSDGVLRCPFQGEAIPMLLRHADVRRSALDWKTFSSDAPFRVPIPSEEQVRTMRQLPIETDPPGHGDYRAIVLPFFLRARQPQVMAQVESLVNRELEAASGRDSVEIVSGFSLPIQSRALAHLLNVPQSEADIWIGWGVNVFRNPSGEFKTGIALEEYLSARLDRAAATSDDDFFGALTRDRYRGRPLTRQEMMGLANLTFAGGRDTMIHSISSVIAWLGSHPESLEFLRQDPARIVLAAEEFFRVFSPLTHIGRVCPVPTSVHGAAVPAGGRIALGWASANFDESVFESPHQVRLARRPNPHIAFGVGPHLCLGAPHARLVVRSLLLALIRRVARINVLHVQEHFEREAAYQRSNGFDTLVVKLIPLTR